MDAQSRLLYQDAVSSSPIMHSLDSMVRKFHVEKGLAPTHICINSEIKPDLYKEIQHMIRVVKPGIARAETLGGLIIIWLPEGSPTFVCIA